MRIRLRVQQAPAGIGLLSADRSVFVQSRRIAPTGDLQTLWFELDPAIALGPLVVHAWDTPEPAKVSIEEISLVW